MKSSLEKQIYLRCPLISRHRDAGPQQNIMSFGFDCGNGWYGLIYHLSSAIEDIAQKLKKTGLDDENLPDVVQVKEKFGGLRFYMHNMTSEIDELIETAEERSEGTCEVCGKQGRPRVLGWIRTRCDQHAEYHNQYGDMSCAVVRTVNHTIQINRDVKDDAKKLFVMAKVLATPFDVN